MKRIIALITCVFSICFLSAQVTAKSLLDSLPPIPHDICTQTTEFRVDFENNIRLVEMKIEALQLLEKEVSEAEELRCGFNQAALQNESIASRLKSLMDEYQQYQDQINTDGLKSIESIIDIEEPLVSEFDEKMLVLTNEYWEEQSNGGNLNAARDKIKLLLMKRCEKLSELRLRNIRMSYDLLIKHWATFERMNALQDETSRILYVGSSMSTENGGLLLDAVKSYLQGLRSIFEWHPSERPMDELGNDDGFNK